MKKIYCQCLHRLSIALLTILIFHFNSNAQQYREYIGASASEIINGTEMVMMDEQNGLPVFVRFSENQRPRLNTVELIFNKLFNAKQVFNQRVDEDQFGMKHYRYQQMHEGHPVFGAIYIVHTKDDIVQSMNGKFFNNFSSVVSPSVSENSALNLVLGSIAADIYKWEIAEEEEMLKLIKHDQSATYYPQGKLIFAPLDGDFKTGDFRLCYEFNIYAHEPMSHQKYFVDATTGEILFSENLIQHVDDPGLAVTGYSGLQPIITDDLGGGLWRLYESGRGGGIHTWNMEEGTSYGAAVEFFDTPDNYWDNANPELDEFAGDTHWGSEMTYDYFYLIQGRDSYTGAGTEMNQYIHYDVGYFNAFYDGIRTTYGDGFSAPLVSLDVVGHEWTHGVTDYSADLIYAYESGALNESFSDIFGNVIEEYADPGSASWLIGEAFGAIRSMSDPESYGDPDTYLGPDWYFGSGDNGGVHTNSGVQNFWFYLLSVGGSGTNDLGDAYSVTGLGIDDAADIAYRNLTYYLIPTSDHLDARLGSVQAAADLFGACSPEVEAVVDAWYAVGVGPVYSPTTTADFSASPTVGCAAPMTVSFTNLSFNADTFTWDFGDGYPTSSSVAPTHIYTVPGTFDVTLTSSGGACGTDVETKLGYIVIDGSIPFPVWQVPDAVTTLTSCTGTLFDSGGPGMPYSSDEYTTTILDPPGSGPVIISFVSFYLEDSWDYVYVYGGVGTGGPLLGVFTGPTLPYGGAPMPFPDAITIVLTSDGFLETDGFEMSWSCVSPPSPPGDDVCMPLPVSLGTNGPFSLAGMTIESGEPSPPTGSCTGPDTWCITSPVLDNTMWFIFYPPASGNVSIQTPDFDTQLAIWSAPTCGDILTGGATLIDANDDDAAYIAHSGVVFSSWMDVFCLTPGVPYFIQLDSYTPGDGTPTDLIITDLGNSPPTAFTGCPSDITVGNTTGLCSATVSWTAPTAGTDPEGCAVSVTSTHSPGASFPVGTTTVTYTSDDGHGGITTCSFDVTVDDTEAPSITVCPATEAVILNSSCEIILPDYTGSVTASDNCSAVTKTQSPLAGTVFSGIGSTSVTVTCTDASGNSSLCTFSVIRFDGTAPTITVCPVSFTVTLNASCEITLADYTGSVTASDNCSAVTKTQTPLAGTVISGVGTTSVSVSCSDAYGNISACLFSVSRVDGTAPTITVCPVSFTVTLNASCEIILADYTGSVTASDNCSSVTKTQSPVAGTVISGVGSTSVTVTCTDASGNSSVCTFSVDRVDLTAPSITVCPGTLTVTLNAACEITLADYTGSVSASDNCSAVTKTQSPVAGSVISGVGTTTVTVTCMDASGNSSVCTFSVDRVDLTAPVISGCPSSIFSSVPIVFWTPPTAVDNCTSVTMASIYSPGYSFPVGTTTVTYFATDAYGNVSTCSFTVTYSPSSGGPVNDDCIGAIDLTSSLSTYTFMSSVLSCVSISGNNLSSTPEVGEISGGCSVVDVTVWYRFTAPTCGPFTMTFSTDNPGTSFDTVVDLFYSPDGSCDFSQMIVVGCNDDGLGGCVGGSSATNSTLSSSSFTSGGVYFVRVDGASAAEGVFELTVSVEPDAPTLIAGTYPSTSIDASWPSTGGAHYDLYWRPTSSMGYATVFGITGTSHTLQNLLPSTSYDVQIKNVCVPIIERYYSPVSSLTTGASTCSSPGTPSCVTETTSSITIAWTSVPAAVYYKLWWRKAGNVGYAVINGLSVTTYTFSNLLSGTTYEFWVRAVCNPGNPSENITGPHGFCSTLGTPRIGNVEDKQTNYQYNFNGATYFNWDPSDLNIDGDISGVEIVNGELQIIPVYDQSINSLTQINIYPNPAETSATIEMDLNETGEVRINIYNLQGEIISSHSVMAESTHLTYSLSLNEIPSGIYQVVIETNGEVMMKKLSVVK